MPETTNAKPFCVQFHDAVRRFPPRQPLRQLGSGLPEHPSFPNLKPLLAEGLSHLFDSGSIAEFGLSANHTVASELRQLLGDLLLEPIVDDQFLLTAGVSDGLSSIFEHCRDAELSVVLPLPCYFGYELAARRAGVRIAAYYDAETGRFAWREQGGPVCLVVNTPDAISGHTLGVDGLRAVELQLGGHLRLTAIDLICAMQRFGTPTGLASVGDLWKGSAAPRKALLFGVTKDLALPGLRAGLLVSDDTLLIERIRWGVLERSFSAGVFVGVVMALYLHLLASLEGCRSRDTIGSEVFGGLTGTVVADFMEYRAMVASGCERTRRLLEIAVPEVRFSSATNHAGYSTFVTVDDGVRGVDEVTNVARRLLANGLQVNPTYMFGGDPVMWEALRPGELHLRVNLSNWGEELRRDTREAVRALRS